MPETRPWLSDRTHRRGGDYDKKEEIVILQSMVIVLAGALLYQALAPRVAAESDTRNSRGTCEIAELEGLVSGLRTPLAS